MRSGRKGKGRKEWGGKVREAREGESMADVCESLALLNETVTW